MHKKKLGQVDHLAIGLLGVFCFDSPTKLVWAINQNSDYNFERIADLNSSVSPKQPNNFHSRFEYLDEDLNTKFTIIKNKGSYQDLIKTNIEIQYFIFTEMGDYDLALEEFEKYLKTLQNIKAIQRLDTKILNKLVAYL